MQILWKYCAKIVQIMWKYCANIVQILCKYCANIVQILCKYFVNIVQILFQCVRVQTGLHNGIQDKKELSVTLLISHSLCENSIHWAAYAAKNLLFIKIRESRVHTSDVNKVEVNTPWLASKHSLAVDNGGRVDNVMGTLLLLCYSLQNL